MDNPTEEYRKPFTLTNYPGQHKTTDFSPHHSPMLLPELHHSSPSV
ncbi:hypothetical protein MHH93_23840 [Priestia sp. FSL H7-0729]